MKTLGLRESAFWVVVALALPLLLVVLVRGASWAYSALVDPYLRLGLVVVFVALVVLIFVGSVICFRPVVGECLLVLSYFLILAVWLLGLIACMDHLGLPGVALGLLLFGLGVVPVGLVAAINAADWHVASGLTALVFVTSGTWLSGLYLVSSTDDVRRLASRLSEAGLRLFRRSRGR